MTVQVKNKKVLSGGDSLVVGDGCENESVESKMMC